MAIDHDAPFQALFDRLVAKLTGLAYTSRRHVPASGLSREQKPALLVLAMDQGPIRRPGGPVAWRFLAAVIVYVRMPDTTSSPDTVLNGFLGQVETALERQDSESSSDRYVTTLGGVCQGGAYVVAEPDAVLMVQGTGGWEAEIEVHVEMVAYERD